MTFVTAEIGSHWQGNYTILKDIIKACKISGVDAVKFQALDVEKICRHPELKYYENSSISPDNIDMVDKICKLMDIEWYCTPTYPDAVEFLDPYVNTYKISVKGSQNNELKDRVFSTGKKVIISTERPFKHDDKRIINLYCIPKYPTTYSDINFPVIQYFDGYSNHCPNSLAIFTAIDVGAKYIEFHLTPSKDYFLLDNKVSFNYEEMFDMLRWIRRNDEYRDNCTSEINKCQVSKQGLSEAGK